MIESSTNGIAVVRSLVLRYGVEELESCLQRQLKNDGNPCYQKTDAEQVINVLAKAGFIKMQMQKGLSLVAAVRELGKRMRAMQGK